MEGSSSSRLSPASSASSLSSLAAHIGSIADSSDGRPDPLSLSAELRPKEASMSIGSSAETATMNATDGRARPRPFQSFRSLQSSGPFTPFGQFHFIAAISLCLVSSVASATATVARQQHRRLEDQDGDFSGEWNGEWQAADNDDYNYDCGDNCGDDDTDAAAQRNSLWLDEAEGDSSWTPEQIITYVSAGILSCMTLLCCVCYPEILVVGYSRVCACCGGAEVAKAAGVEIGEEDADGGGYVGGRQEEQEDGKKRRRRKSKTRSSSRSRDVELV